MNQSINVLENLNPQQVEAVKLQDGPFLVLAGAGSGKTKVLTHRIVHLIQEQKVAPYRILAVTFTNKAAREMKNRLGDLLSPADLSQVWIGTFHGICNRLLRAEIKYFELDGLTWSRNFVIFDAADSLNLIKECLKNLNMDDKIYPPKALAFKISNLKSRAISCFDFVKQVQDQADLKLSEVYVKYQEKLCANNALDFDDLLLITLKLFQTNPERRQYYQERFKHILVDEFQDTNQTQYDLLKMLLFPMDNDIDWQGKSFCAVGDIDQSIYSWRGANYKLTLNLEKDFPGTQIIKLEYNYRSVDPILELANAVIQNNQQRLEKKLLGTKGQGEKINCFEAADEVEEANYLASEIKRLKNKGINLNKMAILYRTNAQSRAIEEALIKSQIAYKLIGGTRFYDRAEIKDIVAYLRLIFNPQDSAALKRIINSPRRGIGPSTIAQIEEKAESFHISLYSALSDLLDSGNLSTRVTKAIHDFIELIDSLIKQQNQISTPDLLSTILESTGYLKALKESDKEDAENRLDNIYELLAVAQQFAEESEDKSLEAFLAQLSLASDLDSLKEEEGSITLLTIHASKGLEYPYVFLTGLEEGIFPNARALNDVSRAGDELEEERRLLYVALTRAEQKLFLTYARNRRLWGQKEYAEPSRFIAEMPQNLLTGYWGGSVRRQATQTAKTNNTESSNNLTESKPKFAPGDQVRHKNFGLGYVTGLFGSKSQKFYAVEFENLDGKKLLSGTSLHKV